MYRYHHISPPERTRSDVNLFVSQSKANGRSLLRKPDAAREKSQYRRLANLPGKKGVAMQLKPSGQTNSWEQNLPRVIALQPYWNYNWSPYRIDQQPENIEFVPMIWGAWSTTGVQNIINTTIRPAFEAGLVKRLLGFNEPDSTSQSNIPVALAVQCWPYLEMTGMPLASPAVAQIEGSWITDFVNQIESKGLYMDYIAVHWYGFADVNGFQSQMLSIYQTYNEQWPLLITEFAPADWSAKTVEENRFSQQQVLAFMQEVLPWIEAQDWIDGYAWFPFDETFPPGSTSALFDSAGNLTVLGEYYASVSTDNPWGDQSITFLYSGNTTLF